MTPYEQGYECGSFQMIYHNPYNYLYESFKWNQWDDGYVEGYNDTCDDELESADIDSLFFQN